MSKKILLADDSMTIQKVVELTFMDQDYEVAAVSDGSSAIARLDESRPDIVIADVHMPGDDGYAVCRHSKNKSPETPVLLLVGTFEQFDEQQAAQAGADDHLKKPFDSQELLHKVQAMVAGGGTAPPPPEPEAGPNLSTQLAAPQQAAPSAPAPAPPVPAAPVPAAPIPAAPAPAAPVPAAPEPTVSEVSVPEPVGRAFQPSVAETRPRRLGEAADAEAEPVAEAKAEEVPVATAANGSLSDADVERIAHRVLELAGDTVLKEIAWEVIPDLVEVVIRERIQELESDVE